MIVGAIILRGSHGGELDREPIAHHTDRAVTDAAIRLIERVTLEHGDIITVELPEPAIE